MATTNINPGYPADIAQLLNILVYKRPHGSASEAEFIEEFIMPYNPTTLTSPSGAILAYVVDNTTASMPSRTIFSSHIDTVHRTSGRQTIAYDANCQLVYKSSGATADNECLGADDGAGMWLMFQMIDAGVPGTYVFHVGEEKGGIGSRGVAEHHADWLQSFDRAVAFDRRGSTDVITHQAMGRCCSDKFARQLANALNTGPHALRYEPCSGGVFTDTANYTHLIPECTNISCGYDAEHGPSEALDVEHILQLRDACIHVDWEAMPTERDPAKVDTYSWGSSSWAAWGYGSPMADTVEDIMCMSHRDLVKWVKANDPEDIADMMYALTDRVYLAENGLDEDDEGPYPYERA